MSAKGASYLHKQKNSTDPLAHSLPSRLPSSHVAMLPDLGPRRGFHWPKRNDAVPHAIICPLPSPDLGNTLAT
jgi:hypothetical protein